jgi:hypothetical protein
MADDTAAMAATLATLFTSPADCVKTRMQVNPETHPSIRLAVKRIYAVSVSRRACQTRLPGVLPSGCGSFADRQGPGDRGVLLWLDAADIEKGSERSDRVDRVRRAVVVLPGPRVKRARDTLGVKCCQVFPSATRQSSLLGQSDGVHRSITLQTTLHPSLISSLLYLAPLHAWASL